MDRLPSPNRRSKTVIAVSLAVLGVLWAVGIALPLAGGYPSIFDWLRDRRITETPQTYDRQRLVGELAGKGFVLGDAAHVRIFKRERVLEVWMRHDAGAFALAKSYPICRFSGGLGPKLQEGDKQAPEGFYRVAAKQLNPHSRHHLAFNLGFPNALDRELGRTGSALMVHGGCSSVGCYAMTDAQIDEIYAVVEAALRRGQGEVDVAIFPFRLTEAALAAEAHSEWQPFWQNLKQGFDLFETEHAPPPVAACNGAYLFGPEALKPGCTPITGWV